VIDNVAAARDAVQHLIVAGHRRIDLIIGRRHCRRDMSVTKAIAAGSPRPASDSALVGSAHFGTDDGYQAANKLLSLKGRPTAIFACNHQSGLGPMRALRVVDRV
jgi:LacI family transcriptional regulator